jgi:hypothetical protein
VEQADQTGELEERAVRFSLGDRLIEIDKRTDCWLVADPRYFKVWAAERVYILRHHTTSGQWELVSFTPRRR